MRDQELTRFAPLPEKERKDISGVRERRDTVLELESLPEIGEGEEVAGAALSEREAKGIVREMLNELSFEIERLTRHYSEHRTLAFDPRRDLKQREADLRSAGDFLRELQKKTLVRDSLREKFGE